MFFVSNSFTLLHLYYNDINLSPVHQMFFYALSQIISRSILKTIVQSEGCQFESSTRRGMWTGGLTCDRLPVVLEALFVGGNPKKTDMIDPKWINEVRTDRFIIVAA